MPIDPRERARNRAIIAAVLKAKGGDGRFLQHIARRESDFNATVRHMHPADRQGSLNAWHRNRARLFSQNPYIEDITLWDHGKGMFSYMPAYHLQRWDPTAHPDVLFDPFVASVVAARLTNRGKKLGAKTWADIDQMWATGKPKRTKSWGPRRERARTRLAALGLPPDLVDQAPNAGDWGTGPQPGQLAVLDQLRRKFGVGSVTPQHDDPQTTDPSGDPTNPTTDSIDPADLPRIDHTLGWILGVGAVGVGLYALGRRP